MLTDAGLGLDYAVVRVSRTSEEWLRAGGALRDDVAALLVGLAIDVEQVGSSSVIGLLAKPIIDLAVGTSTDRDLTAIAMRLEGVGWVYRGDAGEDGGYVFVLESRPWYRVAHLHVVEYGGSQWRNYLRFRDLLRGSPDARDLYEAVKIWLVEADADREVYAAGKSGVVCSLLRSLERGRRGLS
jgi:GrpB-like predicted nucleotidyltransferase (UPF0157 family)